MYLADVLRIQIKAFFNLVSQLVYRIQCIAVKQKNNIYY